MALFGVRYCFMYRTRKKQELVEFGIAVLGELARHGLSRAWRHQAPMNGLVLWRKVENRLGTTVPAKYFFRHMQEFCYLGYIDAFSPTYLGSKVKPVRNKSYAAEFQISITEKGWHLRPALTHADDDDPESFWRCHRALSLGRPSLRGRVRYLWYKLCGLAR